MSEQGNEHAAEAIDRGDGFPGDQEAKDVTTSSGEGDDGGRHRAEPGEESDVAQAARSAEDGERAEAGEDAQRADPGEDGPPATPYREVESDGDRRKREEEFAREHDPDIHDIAAGEEFRQPGDWTAEDTGGPMVQDADGAIVEGPPGLTGATAGASGQHQGDGGESGAGGGESGADEVRDGGFGWGSAAPLEGGRPPRSPGQGLARHPDARPAR